MGRKFALVAAAVLAVSAVKPAQAQGPDGLTILGLSGPAAVATAVVVVGVVAAAASGSSSSTN